MKKIDLNCDMAELMPGQNSNFDQEIMPFITSCNVACGFHSGNPVTITQTILSAIKHNVKIGAHPSYDDRENFGRKSINVTLADLIPDLRYQICAIKGISESLGSQLHHVKAHGALYNDMALDPDLADSIVKLVKEIDPQLKIYGLAQSSLVEICADHNMVFIAEGFADRRYQSRTALRNRKLNQAVINEAEQILRQLDFFSNGQVELFNGEITDLEIDSLCLHSDTEGAVKLSKIIHKYFEMKNIVIE